jgi:hypothetical protein
MPEAEEKKTVDIDTSGPGADIEVAEEKDESVVETEAPKEEAAPTEQEQVKEETTEPVKEDEKLEDYSKGVQSRIAKLTRKMREAERREKAALEYAKAVEAKRVQTESNFTKVNEDYVKQYENRVTSGMESAQKELATAIESGDAVAQVEAQKKVAALSIDSARLNVLKENKEKQVETPKANLSDGNKLPEQTPQQLPDPDPQAESWASKNSWFGQDRAMTFTAFEIHKDLVEREGYDPKSNEYYAEVDKRIRVDFPHKFGNTDNTTSQKPTQNVASANRVSKSGRKTVRLTSSQVAIAKKLGVPLEDYAKQLKLTKEV